MKKLDLNAYSVQKMDAMELVLVNGGKGGGIWIVVFDAVSDYIDGFFDGLKDGLEKNNLSIINN